MIRPDDTIKFTQVDDDGEEITVTVIDTSVFLAGAGVELELTVTDIEEIVCELKRLKVLK